MTRIFQVVLRTLDVDAAKDFYGTVLGAAPTRIVRLHEQAVQRGARPHWLGFIDAGDVDRAAASLLARGGVALGPKWIDDEGLEAAVMRDPGGAILALAKPPTQRAPDRAHRVPEVTFHALNTPDVSRAMRTYGELFGWHFDAPLDLGPVGVFHPFGFDAAAPRAGVFGDIAGRPGVHPHWTFHFRVDSLDEAVARVRSAGGLTLDPIELPSGDRVAVCDDPQGAAFALHELRARVGA
jgi:uncharacterized protein